MRLFFALPVPPELVADLDQRWPVKASAPPHLTLAFLGEQPEERLPALLETGTAIAARHSPLELRTAVLGGFPRLASARVLWLGLEPSPGLEALATDLRQALRDIGLPLDPGPFKAHLTLARTKAPRDLRGLAPVAESPFRVEELLLVESHLEPQGARHVVLGRFGLAQ